MDSVEKEQLYRRINSLERDNKELRDRLGHVQEQLRYVFENQAGLKKEIEENTKQDNYFG